LYQKKPEFGPASMELRDVRLEGAGTPYLLEEGSRLVLSGTSGAPNSNGVYAQLYGASGGWSGPRPGGSAGTQVRELRPRRARGRGADPLPSRRLPRDLPRALRQQRLPRHAVAGPLPRQRPGRRPPREVPDPLVRRGPRSGRAAGARAQAQAGA